MDVVLAMAMAEEAHPTVSLSLTVDKGAEALDFYAEAFGAKETFRLPGPAGGMAHAEFQIGTTKIFLSEADAEMEAHPMTDGQLSACSFSIMVEDCDAAFVQAVSAGALAISEPTDQFWGARNAIVADPYGFRWHLGQLIEEVSNEELAKRAEELFGGA